MLAGLLKARWARAACAPHPELGAFDLYRRAAALAQRHAHNLTEAADALHDTNATPTELHAAQTLADAAQDAAQHRRTLARALERIEQANYDDLRHVGQWGDAPVDNAH